MNAALMIKAATRDMGAEPIPYMGSRPSFRDPVSESVHEDTAVYETEEQSTDDRRTDRHKPAGQSFTQTLHQQLSFPASASSSGKQTHPPAKELDQSKDVATHGTAGLSIYSDGQNNPGTIKDKHTISSASLSTVGEQKTSQATVSNSSGGQTASGSHKGPIKALTSLPEPGKGLHLTESHPKQGKDQQSNITASTTRTPAKQATVQEPAHTSKSDGSINTDKTLKAFAAHQAPSSPHNGVTISRSQTIPSSSAVTQSVQDARSGKTAELLVHMEKAGHSPAQTNLQERPSSASGQQRAKTAKLSAKIMKQASATQSAAKQTSALQAASASPMARSAQSHESKDTRSLDMGMNSGTEWTIELNETTAVGRSMGAAAMASHAASLTKPLESVPLGMQISQQIQASVSSASTLNGHTLMVRLDPPELGRLSITFREQDGVVTGVLEASNAQTRYELRQTLPDIVQHLQASGIQIKRLDVTLVNPSDTPETHDTTQDDAFAAAQDRAFEQPDGPFHESPQSKESANEPYVPRPTGPGPTDVVHGADVGRDTLVSDTGINLLI